MSTWPASARRSTADAIAVRLSITTVSTAAFAIARSTATTGTPRAAATSSPATSSPTAMITMPSTILPIRKRMASASASALPRESQMIVP